MSAPNKSNTAKAQAPQNRAKNQTSFGNLFVSSWSVVPKLDGTVKISTVPQNHKGYLPTDIMRSIADRLLSHGKVTAKNTKHGRKITVNVGRGESITLLQNNPNTSHPNMAPTVILDSSVPVHAVSTHALTAKFDKPEYAHNRAALKAQFRTLVGLIDDLRPTSK